MQDMSKIIPNQPENMRQLGEELRRVSRPKDKGMVNQELQPEDKEHEMLLAIAEAAGNCVKQVDYGFGPDITSMRKVILPWWQYQREQRAVAGR